MRKEALVRLLYMKIKGNIKIASAFGSGVRVEILRKMSEFANDTFVIAFINADDSAISGDDGVVTFSFVDYVCDLPLEVCESPDAIRKKYPDGASAVINVNLC